MWEIPVVGLHVGGFGLELVEELGRWGPKDFVDSVYLIEFAGPVEERVLGDHLKEHTSVPPDVHFGVIISIGHEALRRSIPSGGNILSIGVLAVNSLTRTKISQLNDIASNQHIFGFDIPVEDAFFMYVGDGLEEEVHVVLDFLHGEVFAFDQTFVQVLFHEFEDEGQFA